jgi:hypothetical protein
MNWKETRQVAFGALLACTALGVQACGGDGGTDGTGMTENNAMPTSSVPSPPGSASGSSAPGGGTPSNPTPNNSEPEPATAGEDPGPEAEPEAAEPVGTTPQGEELPVTEEAVAAACAQAVECGQSTELECATELGVFTTLFEGACPGLVGPYIECLGSMEGCDPETACADESAALGACMEEPPEPELVNPEIVEMACATQVRCDSMLDLETCVSSYAVAGPLLEAQCPGAFEPYAACVAEMTGCDPAAECPEEVEVLQACGLEVEGSL